MADHKNLAEALAAFQADPPAVHKNATGQVPGKGKNKYADLANLSAVVLPALAKQGLSFSAKPTLNEQGQFGLAYTLRHVSGEKDDGFFPMPLGTAWEVGSWISYARRYSLQAVTGVAADEDDDGAQASYSTPVGRGEPRNGQQPPAVNPADAARSALAKSCDDNGWDRDIVKNRFKAATGTDLRTATDADGIEEFRKSLFALSDGELRGTPATNGAAQ